MNIKSITLRLFVLFVFGLPCYAEGFGLTADAGVAPTSMGTVGESIAVGLTLPPVFRLDLQGSRMKYLENAADMELYGSKVFGDTSRDSLIGAARLGAVFNVGPFSLNPWGAVSADNSHSYTIVRLLEPGSGLPQDTSRFMDVTGDETVIDMGGGLDLAYTAPRFSFSLSLFLSPTSLWTVETSRFLSGATWPEEIPPPGPVSPTLYWSVRDESLDLTALKYSVNGSVRVVPGKGTLAFGLFGGYSSLAYAGVADINTTGYVAYKTGDGSTPVDELPLEMIETKSRNPARVELSRNSIEAGASCELLFLRELLKVKGSPSLRVSWIRQSRTFFYRYLDDAEDLSAERWEEIADFVKVAISFGLESF